jgi:hypothetical protein
MVDDCALPGSMVWWTRMPAHAVHNGFHLLLFETAPWSQKKKRPLMLQPLTLKDMSPMKLPQLKILRGLNMDMMDTPDQS